MGTSGSYGGSSAAGWGEARQAYEAMGDPGSGAAEAAGGGADGAREESGPTAADVAAAIAQALWDEDPQVRRPTPPTYPIGSLLPRQAGGGGGGGHGGGGRGSTGTSGRAGRGSRRQVAKGAQRGGAAVAAAYALRRGDAETLAELGLDLTELAGLDIFTQSARLLDAMLGEAGHPDERALRKASLEQVKEILRAEQEPTPIDMLQGLAAAYVFELGIIELRAQRKAGVITAEEARRKEIEIRAYINTCARGLPDTFGPVVTQDQFRDVAGRLATNTLRVLRAGAPTA